MSAFVITNQSPGGEPLVSSFIEGMLRLGYREWSECPVCNGSQRDAWLTRMCNLQGAELQVRIDEFWPENGKAEAKQAANELLAMTPDPVGFVTFVGGFGVGKSHLLKGLVNGFRLAGILSVYVQSSADMLASIREMFGDDSKDAAEVLIRRYRGVKVLAWDEVDRFNPTPWAREVIFRVANERYTRREGLLTVLASNQFPAQLNDGDLGYLGSRMNEGRVVVVGGADMRE